MIQIPFIHLRVHSEYSITDGVIRISDLIARAVKFKQPAVALTDLSNVFGLVKFYKKAIENGIKPIIGCDVWISNESNRQKAYRLLLLAKNLNGYLELCELLTRSFLENQFKGRPEIRKEWLQGKASLIVLSGGRYGDIGKAIDSSNFSLAINLARKWKEMFPSSYFIELQRAGFPDDESYVQSALKLAEQVELPVVATHPVQFLDKSSFQAHEVRVCIAKSTTLAKSTENLSNFTEDQYFLNNEEMLQRFSDIPSALQNTVEIAKRCNLTLKLDEYNLPNFPIPEEISLDEYFISLSQDGLKKRLESLFPNEKERFSQTNRYFERLHQECKTIIHMGFSGYFLIVQDFINWGKRNGVSVGPGRGSGAGSLVAYSMGITEIDPIRYDLLFERFLNPERVSMPDFDIDFCQENRDRVIDYVKSKYGRQAVSQIVTYGTLGAKAAIRDTGRVLSLPYALCNSLSKLIPFNAADPWSLDRALKNEPTFKKRYEEDEEIRNLIDLARSLEGLIRNVGMHAGGILIAPRNLTNFCPLYCQPGQENIAVSQFDKDDVESIGLIKFDFLGLRNLTILDRAIDYVKTFNEKKKNFDISSLKLDDPKVYELLSSGNTIAVFQLESRGMKELLKNLKPNSFEEIVAALALYRPGPLESGMVDDFIDRKHGKKTVEYFHPDLKNILQSTYGVIVYQEQVMLISQIIGGYSLGAADLLRRAMGKKKPEEMMKHRNFFEQGARKKGYNLKLASRLFSLMEKFAGYGFNKSHSVAYALIAYQTAWLKAHHPAEFFAATISSDMDDTDKVQVSCRDAIENGIRILPPDINVSNFRFEPVYDEYKAHGASPRTIRYGLGAIKGTGKNAVADILKARKDGPFLDFFDFCHRVTKTVNRRTIESLIKAGAFDSININRAAILSSVQIAMESAQQKTRSKHQSSLFEDNPDFFYKEKLVNTISWDLQYTLINEKSVLGYYFSGHLFEHWREKIRQIFPVELAQIEPKSGSQWVCGILTSIRSLITRRGKLILIVLDDNSAQIEISIFNELYEKYRELLVEDQMLIVRGRVFKSNYSDVTKVLAEELYDFQSAREKMAKSIKVFLNRNFEIDYLKKLLYDFRAHSDNLGVPVSVVYSNEINKFLCTIRLGDEWKIRIKDSLIEKLEDSNGCDGFEIQYHSSI